MSASFRCKCPERKKPVAERNWVVIERNCHYSAFAGYRYTYSEYSFVFCKSCRALGRTKAEYVLELPDGSYDDLS